MEEEKQVENLQINEENIKIGNYLDVVNIIKRRVLDVIIKNP